MDNDFTASPRVQVVVPDSSGRYEMVDPSTILSRISVTEEQQSAILSTVRALDSQLRLTIVLLLSDGERRVHELVTETGASQPLVSQHLKVLKESGVVTSRRVGREKVYSLCSDTAATIILACRQQER
ncbi:ArsR/SmtB family transcription factor [Corynebacterium glucuronolyticum]|uniref:ArsR/SmtB family transcription factor n=1 Tax=Corynebacterium glucuronolyticum TaxID=39791 RepID=UPI0021B009AD|nr:metalloregulator ArsR/SmtB family transcription factor [Corynebacterium glucuronolyticum]MCT1441539.1 metalloregulator ArsR/SmtB family transcription factor [Corynebacterium glucuronolyticum]